MGLLALALLAAAAQLGAAPRTRASDDELPGKPVEAAARPRRIIYVLTSLGADCRLGRHHR